MPEQDVTVTLRVPEGYEATGEYRVPQGEWFLINDGCEAWQAGIDKDRGRRFILRRVLPPTPPASPASQTHRTQPNRWT